MIVKQGETVEVRCGSCSTRFLVGAPEVGYDLDVLYCPRCGESPEGPQPPPDPYHPEVKASPEL
jgi:DNA-directed RNA polymerase subunit RPC12/RpoP